MAQTTHMDVNILNHAELRANAGGRDSAPVRGVPYEPAVLLGASEEPRLSRWSCFDELLRLWRSRDGSLFDPEVRIARKAEISRSRRQPRTQPPTDIIREMVKVDSEGKAEGLLIDSLPWWVSRILRRTQGGP